MNRYRNEKDGWMDGACSWKKRGRQLTVISRLSSARIKAARAQARSVDIVISSVRLMDGWMDVRQVV